MDDAWLQFWDWRSGCTAFIRSVDPESVVRPVYLLDRDEASAVYDPRATGANGVTSIAFSDRFRPLLKRRGDWSGQGFVAILDTERIPDCLHLQGIVFHEYVHNVADREFEQQVRRGDCHPVVLESFHQAADPSYPYRTVGSSCQRDLDLHWHSGPFIRLAIHCAYRAQRAGWLGDAWYVTNPLNYGLTSVNHYERALGDEPARLFDAPLVDVHESEAPQEYQDFAAEDLDRAKQRLADDMEHIRNLLAEDAAQDDNPTSNRDAESCSIRGKALSLTAR